MALPQPAPVKKAYDATGAALDGMLGSPGVNTSPGGASVGTPPAGLNTSPGMPSPSTPGTGIPAPLTDKPGGIPGGESGPFIPPVRPTPDPTKPGATPAPTGAGPILQPGTGPGTPTNPGPAAPGPEAPIDPNAAMGQAQTAFKARFGRDMTPEEQQQLIAAIGYTGGPVTAAQMQQAMQLIQSYGGAPGAPPTTPTPGAIPPGSHDPNVALNQVLASFQTRFGRAMSQQEQDALIQALGYTGGPVTQAQLDQALQYVQDYSGDLANPWGPAPTPATPGPATPTPTPTTPGTPGSGGAPGTPEAEANARLLELLGEKWGEVDPNSAAMRAQRDAFELSAQRGSARKRASMAERAAQRGAINSGGFDVGVEQILDDEASARTAMEGGLIERELQGQRQRLMQGIELAMQDGNQDAARQLQGELAKLDLQLKEYLGKGNLGIGLLQAILNNQQFADSLGLDYAKLQQLMNQQAISAIL